MTRGARVVPAGVAAPYDRADQIRQVRSQREIDLAEIGLARRKGVMLGQLGELAANPRLDQASVPVVEWFREQVHTARSDGRLDELAALLPGLQLVLGRADLGRRPLGRAGLTGRRYRLCSLIRR